MDQVAGFARGDWVAYDRADRVLRLFRADGRLVRTIGRAGAGPGEYRHPAAIGAVSDTSFAVVDPANGRVTVFSFAGVAHRPRRLPREANRWFVDALGRLVAEVARGDAPLEGPGARRQLIWMTLDGRPLDSLPLPDPPPRPAGFALQTAEGVRTAFWSGWLWGLLASGGAVIGHNSAYRVVVQPLSGAQTVLVRDLQPVSLATPERDQWEARRLRVQRQIRRELEPLPWKKPFFRAIFGDDRGWVWVHRYAAATRRPPDPARPADAPVELTWREQNVFDVFTSSGSFAGTVTLPQDSELLAVRGRTIWFKRAEPSGEESVVVAELLVPPPDRRLPGR